MLSLLPLELEPIVSGTLMCGCSRHMMGDKSFFTSFEDFNGG